MNGSQSYLPPRRNLQTSKQTFPIGIMATDSAASIDTEALRLQMLQRPRNSQFQEANIGVRLPTEENSSTGTISHLNQENEEILPSNLYPRRQHHQHC